MENKNFTFVVNSPSDDDLVNITIPLSLYNKKIKEIEQNAIIKTKTDLYRQFDSFIRYGASIDPFDVPNGPRYRREYFLETLENRLKEYKKEPHG